jgi:multiple sugar transport system ATP-binding protein
MATVTFENVSKRFGDVVAVDDLNLDIRDGEFMVLVGPSGCGKTTSLRMVAGLEEISSGVLRIGERIINDVAPKDRDIAMVFQSYALYPHMSIRDNLAFGLKLRHVPKDQIEARVKEAAAILDLTRYLDRKPRELSGGQRQRVALGRAIVREPAVFLMDEPLSNLDAKLRVETRANILRLHQRLATTFVYVTHDQIEAMTMGTRIAVMNEGRLQQVGTPQELYDRPINRFVAGFIGSPAMNFFDALVRGEGESLSLDAGPFQLPIPKTKASALLPYRGKKVILGVRPESIHDTDFPRSGVTPVPVKANVDVLELMGNEVFLHLISDGTNFLARVDPRTKAKPGKEIQVLFDLGAMQAFDSETQLVIPLDKPL